MNTRSSEQDHPGTRTRVVACAFLAAWVAACSKSPAPTAAKHAGATQKTVPDAGHAADAASTKLAEASVADVSQELRGGNGPFIGAATGLTPPDGYEEHEYVASGTAIAYQAMGSLTDDGHFAFVPSGSAAYRTRILVRRPADAARASGTVIVEWLNVSGGVDANPEYASLAEEISRQGHT